MSKRACFRQLRSVLRIGEPGSSYWPTPTAAQSGNLPEFGFGPAGIVTRTPTNLKGKQLGLCEVSKCWTVFWMMSRALNLNPGPVTRYPYSLPLHLTFKPGTRHLPGTFVFNPAFTDWMMGWPIGWSDPQHPVTGWSVWLRRMRGALSEVAMRDVPAFPNTLPRAS